MGAYIEMLPPDRPIFMLGQPIIKLVASGGPGGDLGDMGRRTPGRDDGASQDAPASYFVPKDIPGLPSKYEGPHTSRRGIYPKKLRDQVVYDMSGNNAFVSLSDIAAATTMPNFGGSLGCCGADGMGEPWNGKPARGTWNGMGNFGMPLNDDAAPEAKLLKGRCAGIEAKAREIVAAVAKAENSSLTAAQKKLVVKTAKQSLHALRGEWRMCRSRLKEIIGHFKKQGNLKEFGLSGMADAVAAEDKVSMCKAKLREIVCKKKR